MRGLVLFTSAVLTLMSCSNIDNHPHYEIMGSISQDSINIKEIILLTQSDEIKDTTVISSNKFSFKGTISEPTNAAILLNGKMIRFPLVNDEIKLKITNTEEKEFEVQYLNSKVNVNLQSYFKQDAKKFIKEYKKLLALEVNCMDNKGYSIAKDSLVLDFFNQLYTHYRNTEKRDGLSIIVSDLTRLFGTKNHPEKINELFQMLPDNQRTGYYGKKVKKYLDQSAQVTLGQSVEFNFTDAEGVNQSTKNYKGKLILLEFWASWCGPFISQIPSLKQVSKKSDKIQIISISIDDDLEKWKKKIADLEINWTNIHYKQESIDLKKKFFVNGVPYNVLLSQDGKILRKNINVT